MQQYRRGGLVPGCEWQTNASKDAEIVARAVAHMHATRGADWVNQDTVGQIKQQITEKH